MLVSDMIDKRFEEEERSISQPPRSPQVVMGRTGASQHDAGTRRDCVVGREIPD